MQSIHKLTQDQIAKIAAGEVIEKPAFAVKELIENSIDAKATHIQIILEEGGLKKIQIIDDGIGMSEEDLKECFKLHTTSKVNPDDDLVSIRSMGFRGEALASIASISHLTIQSRQDQSPAGNQIIVEEGKLVSSKPIGMPVGTQIEVLDLFYSVPGRKKFIENSQKEYRIILDWVIRIALTNPSIRFSLKHNQKLIFDLPKNQTLLQRLQFFLREELNLLQLEYEDTYIRITGLISHPSVATSSSSKQFIFINNRPINDRLVAAAVREAYGNTIDHNKYPIYSLNIFIPHEMVDVNVHPRKEQVNVLNRQLIFDQVQKAIYQTLQLNSSANEIFIEKSITKSFAGQLLKSAVELFGVEKKFDLNQDILQIFNLYLVFQAQDSLILVDQHAAHERILYEQLKTEFEKRKIKKIKLQKPITLNLSLSETEIIRENTVVFESLGFYFKQISPIPLITQIPQILQDRDMITIITQLIEQLSQDRKPTLDNQTDQMLKYLACRSAVKQGDSLSQKRSQDLIKQLFKTPNYTNCPHGRPTFIQQPLTELNKQFKRF